MARISMNELTTFRWSFDEDVLHYQHVGFQSIGLWRRKLADFGEERAVELLAESQLQVSSLFFAGGFTGGDGRSFAESIDDAAAALRLAAELGAGCLTLFTGGRNNHTYRHSERLLRTALDELLPLAEMFDVPLALKPKHAACAGQWTFFTDLNATLAFVEQYDSPLLKIIYDTYQFPYAHRSPDLLADLVPYLALVHVADGNGQHTIDEEQCPLGDGTIRLEDAITALLEAGYDGDFEVKLSGPEIEPARYHEILQRSQQSMSNFLSALARTG
jgi:sugar phosphate isomerase/epimerase